MSNHKLTNREAIDFTIAFIKGNWTLSLSVTTILVILSLLTYIQHIGFIFFFIHTILLTSVMIYIARVSRESYFIENMESVASKTSIKDIFIKYIEPAIGFNIGFGIIFLILGIVFLMFLNGAFPTGGFLKFILEGGDFNRGHLLLAIFIIFVVIFWVGYLYPAVAGYTFMADSFKEAFYRSFELVNPGFWRRTLNREYFKFIATWGSINLGFAIIFLMLFTTYILIPIALLSLYFIWVYNSIIYVHSQYKLEQ